MLKIATHNSGTGEKPMWYSWILTPFARCQGKTIKKQYEAGCRLFDIRVKLVGGKWKVAHGLWITKRSAEDILSELNSFQDSCHITLTYEGTAKHNVEFLDFVKSIKATYTNIKYGPVAVKYGESASGIKVKYDYILDGDDGWIDASSRSHFLALDGTNWRTYIPIPWLWKKIYYNKPEFREDIYTYVDFL
jgi:hypothetical protein